MPQNDLPPSPTMEQEPEDLDESPPLDNNNGAQSDESSSLDNEPPVMPLLELVNQRSPDHSPRQNNQQAEQSPDDPDNGPPDPGALHRIRQVSPDPEVPAAADHRIQAIADNESVFHGPFEYQPEYVMVPVLPHLPFMPPVAVMPFSHDEQLEQAQGVEMPVASNPGDSENRESRCKGCDPIRSATIDPFDCSKYLRYIIENIVKKFEYDCNLEARHPIPSTHTMRYVMGIDDKYTVTLKPREMQITLCHNQHVKGKYVEIIDPYAFAFQTYIDYDYGVINSFDFPNDEFFENYPNIQWEELSLKNCKISDWVLFVYDMINQGTISLDMTGMIHPSSDHEYFTSYWWSFGLQMKNAHALRSIVFYNCPHGVMHEVLKSLHILSELSVITDNLSQSYPGFNNENIDSLGQLIMLRKLKINGGMEFLRFPSLELLVNLKSLSLTNGFHLIRNNYALLESVTENLESLQIGDCAGLSLQFNETLKRFTHLTYLRLENCRTVENRAMTDEFADSFAEAVRSLRNLWRLELVGIDFSRRLENSLGRCNNITSLLVIPNSDDADNS